MIRRRLIRVAVWSLAALVLLAAAGFLWLRQSPYWAGITLFSESHRVENFRDMGRVFPARTVPRGETVWAFDHAPQPLPKTCTFGGQDRSLAAFPDRTETTGLLVAHRRANTPEGYRLGVSKAHALPGSELPREARQPVPLAAGPKSRSFAQAIPMVARKAVIA